MKIHEYQAKEIFASYNIPVPHGSVANTPEEAYRVAQKLGSGPYILKAQIHAGGRGLDGGIGVVKSLEEVQAAAADMLGKILVTYQTGKEGKPVNAVLVEEELSIEKEIYLGITIDRNRACPVVLASTEGGMEIEQVASEHPGKIISEAIELCLGLRAFQTRRIFYALGLDQKFFTAVSGIIANLYKLFIEKDCSLAEINPLVITRDGTCVALDGKLNFDDNGLFKHADIRALRDRRQENALEVKALQYNLNYIKMSGHVGCMVNGAGLAMATMDLIKFVGAEPSNFLDVGGGATEEMISEGFKILLADADVQTIFINIFGGILRCDVLAEGVVRAAKERAINLPVIVRLEGTNVVEGRKIFAESGLPFTIAADLKDAAMKIREYGNSKLEIVNGKGMEK